MTVYIFDENKRVRRIIPPDSISELVHDEANFQLHAEVSMKLLIKNGEHLGFMCADKRFRLFTVVISEDFDDRGVTIIVGTDAAVQELKETIVESCNQTATIKTTANGLLSAAGAATQWSVIGEDSTETKETKAYYTSVWSVLEQCMGLYLWNIVPYYTFQGGQISGRVIELSEDKPVYRGRILNSKKDATNVYAIRTDPPITRLYGVGGSAGTGDMQTAVTFSGVSWSKAAGNPADKPAGQSWVEDPEAAAKHGVRAAVLTLSHIQSPEELLQETWKELQRKKEPPCTVEANVQDMEQVPGYQHQIIRLGDRVPIRFSNATMEAARVVNIKRDYIRPWLTKVVLGEKVKTIQTQMRQVQSAASSISITQDHVEKETEKHSSAIKQMGEELKMDAALIQLNAEMIQANATVIEANAQEIRANAELIDLKAGKQEVDELGERVTAAEVKIDGIEAEVLLKASKAELSEFESRLSTAEVRIDGAEAAIALKAEQTTVNSLGERITSAELRIDGAESKIEAKADLILLDGYVKANELEAQILTVFDANIESAIAEYINAYELDVSSLVASSVNTNYLSADAITSDSISTGDLTVGGTSFTSSSLTMGSVASGTIVGPTDINLSHSHAVTVSGGTVTLGEVSSSGGSFNIADTQFYIDGVAAAKEEGAQLVIVSNMYGSGGVITAELTNGKEATLQLSQGSVSGTDIPIMGRGSTVMTVDASSVYNNGANSVTLSVGGWSGGSNTVTASNGKSATVNLPSFSTSGGTSWSNNQTTVYFYTGSVSGYLASKTVDATSVYNNGWNDCRDAAASAEVYTISEYAPGTLYVKVGDYYSSAGSSWVKVTRKYGVYTLPSAKG